MFAGRFVFVGCCNTGLVAFVWFALFAVVICVVCVLVGFVLGGLRVVP